MRRTREKNETMGLIFMCCDLYWRALNMWESVSFTSTKRGTIIPRHSKIPCSAGVLWHREAVAP